MCSKTETAYIQKAEQSIRSVLKSIAPDESDHLLQQIARRIQQPVYPDQTIVLRNIYQEIDISWQLRKQMLSIITEEMTQAEAEKASPLSII